MYSHEIFLPPSVHNSYLKLNQIILMVYEAVKTTINDQVEVYGRGYLGVSFFYVGRCVLREWVVGGGG